jgi:hypothetical protein
VARAPASSAESRVDRNRAAAVLHHHTRGVWADHSASEPGLTHYEPNTATEWSVNRFVLNSGMAGIGQVLGHADIPFVHEHAVTLNGSRLLVRAVHSSCESAASNR